jgi:hypothetical protein
MQHCSHSRPALIRVARIPTATFFGVFDGGSGIPGNGALTPPPLPAA